MLTKAATCECLGLLGLELAGGNIVDKVAGKGQAPRTDPGDPCVIEGLARCCRNAQRMALQALAVCVTAPPLAKSALGRISVSGAALKYMTEGMAFRVLPRAATAMEITGLDGPVAAALELPGSGVLRVDMLRLLADVTHEHPGGLVRKAVCACKCSRKATDC